MPPIRLRRSSRRLFLAVTAVTALGLFLLFVPPMPRLLEVVSPAGDVTVGLEGIEVIVRFRHQERVAAETFRVLLNGAEVTEAFTTGENGAYGQLHGLLDGENELLFEVFGRGWLGRQRLYAETRSLTVTQRPPLNLFRG